MTNVDPTRSRSSDARPDDAGLNDLVAGGDPLACEACLATGGECDFHRGWAEGWDACGAFVARRVHEAADGELHDPTADLLWLDDEPGDRWDGER
jgi:hypothetical protein